MAYTAEQLYNLATLEAESFATLSNSELAQDNAIALKSDLANNPSQVGIMRLIVWVCALMGSLLSQMFDLFRKDVDLLAQATYDGSDQWLIEKLKDFQFGNGTFKVVGGRAIYDIDMPLLKCIDHVAFRRDEGLVICLLAQKNLSTGRLERISSAKLTAVKTYLIRVKKPGTNLDAASYDADLVKFSANVYYDGLVEPASVSAQILDSVESYLANLNKFSQEGLVEDEKLTDYIQAVPSVRLLAVIAIEGRSSLGVYTNDNATVGYPTVSGYAVLDRSNCILNMLPA